MSWNQALMLTADALSRPPARLPAAADLAGLGTVLCLYRADQSSELAGWVQASSVVVHEAMDSDGLHESLWFFDADRICCWRLYLLPDSDFLGWDRVVSQLPAADDASAAQGAGVAERLWRRLAGRLAGDTWKACALRLHATVTVPSALAASVAPLSVLGASIAARIAGRETVIGDIGVDDGRHPGRNLALTAFAGSRANPVRR